MDDATVGRKDDDKFSSGVISSMALPLDPLKESVGASVEIDCSEAVVCHSDPKSPLPVPLSDVVEAICKSFRWTFVGNER